MLFYFSDATVVADSPCFVFHQHAFDQVGSVGAEIAWDGDFLGHDSVEQVGFVFGVEGRQACEKFVEQGAE